MRHLFKAGLCLLGLVASPGALRADEAKADAKAETKPRVSTVPAVKSPERHAQFLKDKEANGGKAQVVFIGDSITDGWRNGEQKKIFDKHWGEYHPLNFGIGGDRTEHVLWRVTEGGELDGLKPKVVVMMIGTNNVGHGQTAEDGIAGVQKLVPTIREKLPEAKILLLAVFPRGETPDHPMRVAVNTMNEQIKKLDDGKNVRFLDIGAKFMDDKGNLPKEIMHDALHLTPKGYQIWAEAIDPTLKEMMK